MNETVAAPISSTPQATPVAAPEMSAPTPAPVVVTPTPSFSTPSYSTPPPSNSNGLTEFFKSINWIEVSCLFLGAVGIYYTIYFYRYKLREERVAHADMHRRLDSLSQDISGLISAQVQQSQAPVSAGISSFAGAY